MLNVQGKLNQLNQIIVKVEGKLDRFIMLLASRRTRALIDT